MLIALYVLGVILAGLVGYLAYVGSKTTKEQAQKISALQIELEGLKKALDNAVTKEAFEGQITLLHKGIAPLVVEETVERFAQLERQATTALFMRGRAIETRLFSGRNGNGNGNDHGNKGSVPKPIVLELEAQLSAARQKREQFKSGSPDHVTLDYQVQSLKYDLAHAKSDGHVTRELLEADIALSRWQREHSAKGSSEWTGFNSRVQELKAQLGQLTTLVTAGSNNN